MVPVSHSLYYELFIHRKIFDQPLANQIHLDPTSSLYAAIPRENYAEFHGRKIFGHWSCP